MGLFATSDGKTPLKGLTRKDRKLWDKTAKETVSGYDFMSPMQRDYNYYISTIKARGYNQGEVYDKLWENLDALDENNYEGRNNLLIDYFNSQMTEETERATLSALSSLVDMEGAQAEAEDEDFVEARKQVDSLYYQTPYYDVRGDNKKKGFWGSIKDALVTLSSPTRQDIGYDKALAKQFADDIVNKRNSEEDVAAKEYSDAQKDLEHNEYIVDNNIATVMNRAEEVSSVMQNTKIRNKFLDFPIYNNERPEDGITWESISNEYQGVLNKYLNEGKSKQEAEQRADTYLQRRLQNIAYERQPWYSQYGNGFIQLGETVLSTAISFAAMGRGLVQASFGQWDYYQGETWFEYLMDAVNNNPWAVAANTLSQYGTFNKEVAERLEKEGGFRYNPIISSWESDNGHLGNMFDGAFLPNVIGQQGFTIALAATSFGASAAASKGIVGASRAARLANISKLRKEIITAEQFASNAAQIAKKYDRINKIANAGIAFLSGIPEGHQNGYDTKKRILEDGEEYLDEIKERDLYDAFLNYAATSLSQMENEEQAEAAYEYYKKYFGDAVLAANQEKYDDIENQIIVSAIRGATHNTVWTNLLNGSINSTLNLTVQAPKVRNTLRKTKLAQKFIGNPDDFRVTRDAAGKVTVRSELEFGLKKFLNNPYVKAAERPIGEALEEGGQNLGYTMFSKAAYNHIANYVHNNYGYSDINSEIFDGGISDFAAAWTGFWDGTKDKETYKAAIYGAAGAILGTPKFGGYRHQGGSKTFERREGENVFEYIRRVTPWQSIGAEYSVHRAEIDKSLADARELEEFLNKPENKELADFVLGISNIEMDIQNATNAGDGFMLRNDHISRMVRQAAVMHRIENSSVAQDWYAQVDAMASMEKGTELANKSIEDYKKKMDLTDTANDDEIFDTLKENAQKLKTVIEQTNQALETAEYNFPGALPQAQEAYAYAMVMLQNQEGRIKNLREETSTSEKDVSTDAQKNSSLTDAEKSAIIAFGSVQKAGEEITKMEQERSSLKGETSKLEKNIDKLNKSLEKNPEDEKTKSTVNKLQQELDKKERRIKQLDALLEPYEGIDRKHFDQLSSEDALLTEVDILGLTPQQKAQLYKNYREGKYKGKKKDIQQKAIDKVVKEGLAKDPEYIDKVIDLGRLEASRESLIDGIASITEDIQKMDNFVSNQYLHRALGFYKNEGRSLSKIQDYNEFVSAVTNAFSSNDPIRGNILQSVLDEENSDNWQKYKKSVDYANKLIEYASKNPEKHEIFGVRFDKQNLETFKAATVYLTTKGVDLSDSNAVREALEERNDKGELLLQNFIKDINKGRDKNHRVLFDSIEAIYGDYLKYVDGFEFDKATEARIKEMPKPEVVTPEKPVKTPKQDEAIKPERQKKIDDLKSKDFTTEESSKAALDIWDIIDNSGLNKELKSLIYDELMNMENNLTKETIVRKISSLLLNSKTKDSGLKKLIGKTRNKVESLIKKQQLEDAKQPTTNGNAASNIKIIGEEAFSNPNTKSKGIVAEFFKTHKVKEFLSDYKFGPDAKIFFAVSPDLYTYTDDDGKKQLSPYFQSSGLTAGNITILALVEVDKATDTTFEKDGKYFQPIGILPQTGNTTTRGAANVDLIRDFITQDILNTTTTVFLTDGDNKLLSTNVVVNAESSMQPGVAKPLDEFLQDVGTTSEERKEDFAKNTIFTDNSIIYYPVGNKEGITLWRIEPKDTTQGLNSNVTFGEILHSGTLSNISDFNYFTQLFSAILSDKLSKEGSTILTDIKNGELSTAAENLKKALNSSLHLRNGFSYSIQVSEDGKLFDVILQKEGANITLLENLPVEALEGEELPRIDKTIAGSVIKKMAEQDAFVWQVSQSKMRKSLDEALTAEEKNYLEKIYDQAVLSSGKVSSPYKEGLDVGIDISELAKRKRPDASKKIKDVTQAPVVSNPENADTNSQQGRDKTKGDSLTSAEINSEKIDNFVSESKKLTRKEDKSGYIDKTTGKSSVRVTSIIRADEEPSNGRDTVATSLGNVVDKMLKEYFTAKKINWDNYRGVKRSKRQQEGKSSIDEDFSELYRYITSYDNEAWSFLDPKEEEEFKITGNMTVKMEDGNLAEIPVSGAMDLVFRNARGDRLLIVDTKSHNSLYMSEKSKKEYIKQLSLYAAFVSEKFGIQTDILIADVALNYQNNPNVSAHIDAEGNIIDEKDNSEVEATISKVQVLSSKDEIVKLDKKDIVLDFSEMSEGMKDIISNIIRENNSNVPQGNISSVVPSDSKTTPPTRKTTIGGKGRIITMADRHSKTANTGTSLAERDEFVKSFETTSTFKMVSMSANNIVEKEMSFKDLPKDIREAITTELNKKSTVEECKRALKCNFNIII